MKRRYSAAVAVLFLFLMGLLIVSCGPKKPGPEPTPTQKADNKNFAFFPLKEGNNWVYEGQVITGVKNRSPIETNTVFKFKAAGKGKVGAVETYVMEGYIGKTDERMFQREFYEFTDDALVAHKRIMYPEEGDVLESMMEPPEAMVMFPLDQMKSWSWKGVVTKTEKNTITGQFDFKVTKKEKIKTPAGEFDAYKVEMEGTTTDGSKVESSKWYAENVGMVREISRVTYDVPSQEKAIQEAVKNKQIKESEVKNYPVIETVDMTGNLKSYTIDGITTPIPGREDSGL